MLHQAAFSPANFSIRGLLDYDIPLFPLPYAYCVFFGEGSKGMPASISPALISPPTRTHTVTDFIYSVAPAEPVMPVLGFAPTHRKRNKPRRKFTNVTKERGQGL